MRERERKTRIDRRKKNLSLDTIYITIHHSERELDVFEFLSLFFLFFGALDLFTETSWDTEAFSSFLDFAFFFLSYMLREKESLC